VSVLVLAFTIGAFWWLNTRRGSLTVTCPKAHAFADKVRLRLRLAFFNTGVEP
jgi:hypothetical protein